MPKENNRIIFIEGARKTGKTTWISDRGYHSFKDFSYYYSPILSPIDLNSYFFGKDIVMLQMLSEGFRMDHNIPILYIDRGFISSIIYGSLYRNLNSDDAIKKYWIFLQKLVTDNPNILGNWEILLIRHTNESVEKAVENERKRENDHYIDTRNSLWEEDDLFGEVVESFFDIFPITSIYSEIK